MLFILLAPCYVTLAPASNSFDLELEAVYYNTESNMDLRKEIELLARWYIPVFLITAIGSAILTGFNIANSFDLLVSGEKPAAIAKELTVFFSHLVRLVIFANNIVVAIWLYFQGKKENGKALLWLLFGLVAHLFAALIYIGLKIYEQNKQTQSQN